MALARRDFLTTLAAAGGATMFAGCGTSSARQARKYAKPVIDLHFHMYPREFMDLLEKEGAANGAVVSKSKTGALVVQTPVYKRGFNGEEIILKPEGGGGGGEGGSSRFGDPLKTDVTAMIKDMDDASIDMNVCNQTNPHVLWAPPAFGLKLAQAINDGTSRLHQQHPTRFVGAISLAAAGRQALAAGARARSQAARHARGQHHRERARQEPRRRVVLADLGEVRAARACRCSSRTWTPSRSA